MDGEHTGDSPTERGDEPEEHQPDQRRRSTGTIVAVVFGVMILLLGGVALVLRGLGAGPDTATVSGSAAGDGGTMAISCLAVGPMDEHYCDRVVHDTVARRRLTADQMAELNDVARRVERSVTVPRPYVACGYTPGGGPCPTRNMPPSEQDVVTVRGTLTAAGYATAVVRLARPDDPAPLDSLLYAVPIAPGCVIGAVMAGGSSVVRPAGTYPDGTCLHR